MEKNYLEIMDYKNDKTKTTIDLNKLDEIQSIRIEIITGDEICEVQYKNGKRETFDSSNERIQDFFDDSYVLYDVLDNTNFIEEFKKRENSYDTDFLNNEVR